MSRGNQPPAPQSQRDTRLEVVEAHAAVAVERVTAGLTEVVGVIPRHPRTFDSGRSIAS